MLRACGLFLLFVCSVWSQKWTTSRVMGSPEPPAPYRLGRVYPQLTFKEPVFIAQDPMSERLMVAEYKGKIFSFRPGDATGRKDLFLDMKRGVSAFSFHPKYKENGFVFVFSHLDPKVKGDQLSRVSRFELERGSDPPRLRPESERIIIEWPAGGHNGGEAIVGPDGYLYIATGDSTGGSDKKDTGQGVDDLLSVMMRLDVDHPDPGRNYSIPKDNPFINMPGARPEIWAYGFRNPWRFSFDPETGQPWVGDVGQDLWEMIELVSRGSNHGWSVKEGNHPFFPNRKPGPTPFTPPIVEHHHMECRSITGGYVYQGDKFPELRGAYLYGDYEYGKLWGLRYDHKAKKVTWHNELADTAVKISSFGVTRDGSFLALDYGKGEIYQLERQPALRVTQEFPRKLSQTGLFTNVARHEIAPGVQPYAINAPFWSDGAGKERFFALPGDATVQFNEKKNWVWDDGAVTVKSFKLGDRRIETRIMVKQDDHWVGYTYMWNDEQTDAELVGKEGLDRRYGDQVWHFPSRNECMFCHSRAAGFVLGLTTPQMNKGDQLARLAKAGVFKKAPTKSNYPAYPNPFDKTADLTTRVKTYFEVNCAMCHVSDGGGNSLMELGFKTPLEKARIVNEPPTHEDLGLKDARLIAPGDPQRSVLYHRITRRGEKQMPPTSTNRVDEEGAKLIEEWIRQLAATPQARPARAGAAFR